MTQVKTARAYAPTIDAVNGKGAMPGHENETLVHADGRRRLAVPSGDVYPWYVRLIFALQRRRYGAELESARI
ncbi:MAG: hypothetical protein WD155_04760, partial [Burkholderiales bacterium]